MNKTRATTATPPRFQPLRVLVVVAYGVAVLVLGNSDPIEPTGTLGKRLESEIRMLAGSAGSVIAKHDCSMMGNLNFAVTCQLARLSMSNFHNVALAAGWRAAETGETGPGTIFAKDGLRLAVEFHRTSPVVSITITKLQN